MTNFEKIKTLSIVDLAYVLENIHDEEICAGDPFFPGERFRYCFASFLSWLGGAYNMYCDTWKHTGETDIEVAIRLLKECIEPDPKHPFKTTIAGERREKILEFIKRCGE